MIELRANITASLGQNKPLITASSLALIAALNDYTYSRYYNTDINPVSGGLSRLRTSRAPRRHDRFLSLFADRFTGGSTSNSSSAALTGAPEAA